MARCDLCGFDNVPGTLFCEGCGAGLTAAAMSGARHATAARAATAPTPHVTGDIETAAEPAATAPENPFAPQPAQAPTGRAPAPNPANALGAYLIAESGRRLDVPAQEVVIVGREDMRSGIRPDVDLTLDGASAAGVSRRHCRLLRQPDGWHVEDLMSTNYTVLNGKPLPAHTPTLLHDGDELRLGKMRLRFYD